MRDGKIVLAEIGVGPPSMCYGLLFADKPGTYIQLYEPHPVYCAQLRGAIAGRPNVELFEVAIGDEPGTMELCDEGTSSSLVGVSSPSQQHRGTIDRKTHTVKVERLSAFDKGDIDHLRLDTEGHEWSALKYLVSRPEQIVVEIYNDLGTYINPHLYEIVEWAAANGYVRAHVADSDFIFLRRGQPTVTPLRPALATVPTLEQCLAATKQMLLGAYTTAFYGKVPADQFVDTLSRVFRLKGKVIANLSAYVHGQAQQGRHPDGVLQSLDFYAAVLASFTDRNLGQPLRR